MLIIGFSALPLRALLFAAASSAASPYLLVPVQMLDGISAAVFGVMLPLIAADVAGGKGRRPAYRIFWAGGRRSERR